VAAQSQTRVLLVEDDDDSRELMAEVLAVAGYAVHPVANGPDALRALSERPYDVLVTDLGMSGMGGLEIARAAKATAPALPVIVVTGWAERDDVEQARGRVVDAVLLKPVDPDSLTQAVASSLAGRGRGV
jgi:CheY-like chemotaxis protein